MPPNCGKGEGFLSGDRSVYSAGYLRLCFFFFTQAAINIEHTLHYAFLHWRIYLLNRCKLFILPFAYIPLIALCILYSFIISIRYFPGSRDMSVLDPFLMLDHMGPSKYGPGEAVGAPDHPHRGFETVCIPCTPPVPQISSCRAWTVSFNPQVHLPLAFARACLTPQTRVHSHIFTCGPMFARFAHHVSIFFVCIY